MRPKDYDTVFVLSIQNSASWFSSCHMIRLDDSLIIASTGDHTAVKLHTGNST